VAVLWMAVPFLIDRPVGRTLRLGSRARPENCYTSFDCKRKQLRAEWNGDRSMSSMAAFASQSEKVCEQQSLGIEELGLTWTVEERSTTLRSLLCLDKTRAVISRSCSYSYLYVLQVNFHPPIHPQGDMYTLSRMNNLKAVKVTKSFSPKRA
jgi:hypothetical protein